MAVESLDSTEKFVVGDFRDLGAVIPSLLDDYGLDPYEFRVYARLARRAGNHGQCWESIPNIAQACKMSDRKVQYCLRLLEKAGLISRCDRKNDTTLYSLNHTSKWVNLDKLEVVRQAVNGRGAPDAPPKTGRKSKKEVVHNMHPGGAPDAPKGFPPNESNLKQGQEHEQVSQLRNGSGCDRACSFSDDVFGGNGHCQNGSDRSSVATHGTNQTAVDQPCLPVANSSTFPSPPVAPPPSPQFERVPKKSRAVSIKFTINDLGWLQLPKAKRFSFVRWLAVRRLNYQMACAFKNINPASDERGKTVTEGGQLVFDWDGDRYKEEDLLGEDGRFSVSDLRDDLFEKNMLSQEAFNDFLEYLFRDSLEWASMNGINGRKLLKKQSAAFTFFNADRDVFQKLRGQ